MQRTGTLLALLETEAARSSLCCSTAKAENFLLLLKCLFVDRSTVKNIGESYWNTRAVGREQLMLLPLDRNGELIIIIVVTVVLGVDLNEVGYDVELLEKINYGKNEMR